MIINAAVIEKPGEDFRIVEMELDDPKDNEVLVQIKACGVCHTDEVARQQFIPVPLPAVFGHEGAGIIEKVGPFVKDFKPGDRVSFSYGYCGDCEPCKTGHPYGCYENRRLNFSGEQADGTKRRHYHGKDVSGFFGQGAFANYAVVHVNNLIKVPDDIPLELAAPIGCGIQTGAGTVLNYLKPSPDSTLMVTGCGAVGLSAIMAAKITGSSVIIACDVVQSRLEMAKKFGATHTINSREVSDIVAEAKRITDGKGVHYSIDCTGIGQCVKTSLDCTRTMGTCAVVGATQELEINVENELVGPAKTLRGIVEGLCIPQLFIPELLNYYKQGRFPFDELISFYNFEDINKAFDDTKKGEVIKAVLKM